MKTTILTLLFSISLCGFTQDLVGEAVYGEVQTENFGEYVAISGDGKTFIANAPGNQQNDLNSGSAAVYTNIGNDWVQVGARFYGTSYMEQLGKHVDISNDGSIIAISASKLDNGSSQSEGVVYVYQNVSNNWVMLGQPILGKSMADLAGTRVSLSGDGSTIAITSPGSDENGSASGQVRVFEFVSNAWVQLGQDINGYGIDAAFGYDVSISNSGDRLAASSINNTTGATMIGYVMVYENINGVWTQIGQTLNGAANEDRFGRSIALSGNGNTLIVGAAGSDINGNNSGTTSIFDYTSNNWTLVGQEIHGQQGGASEGWRVSISDDGNTIGTGATSINYYTGQVRVFYRTGSNWTQLGNDMVGDNTYDNFASNMISADGTTIVTGAFFNDSIGNNAGQVKVFDFSRLLNTENLKNSQSVHLYPNPASNEINIKLSTNANLEEIIIYDVLGQKVKSSKEQKIIVSDLTKGSYFIDIITDIAKTSKKLIIN
ncbi:T9SS type A sorting domain-containing protein [Brumimicrobium mesophilum]|uniref:T9SS type A sorting domain-containing protein n=1 Tax=Brumimicrobium mesophilum TaxID=392717 RepID=UPI000D1422C7|nr:T9SS type A sorting domain-containing protein [Brumimicrobium mesophilum]